VISIVYNIIGTMETTMLIGYARTSTLEQEAGLEAQERDLAALGCEKVMREQTSSVGPRPVLEQALDFLREGDTLVVTKLDRLARSVVDLWTIVQRIEAKKAGLRIVAMGIDTGTPTGRLMLSVVGAVAQFEREMMLERQREGIAKAKAEGKYKGRKPTAALLADKVREMHGQGQSMGAIATALGIGKGSVHRAIRAGS
jgi:DNA invertase Pin-like site-specific DNA recombinase